MTEIQVPYMVKLATAALIAGKRTHPSSRTGARPNLKARSNFSQRSHRLVYSAVCSKPTIVGFRLADTSFSTLPGHSRDPRCSYIAQFMCFRQSVLSLQSWSPPCAFHRHRRLSSNTAEEVKSPMSKDGPIRDQGLLKTSSLRFPPCEHEHFDPTGTLTCTAIKS